MAILSEKKSEIVTDPYGYMWFFYGGKGQGKSTLASRMADPYFICMESAHRHLSIYKSDVTTWDEIEGIVKEVCTGTRFKTIVFDPMSPVHQLLCKHVAKEAEVEDINDGVLGYGKGYKKVKLILRNMLNFIGDHGKGVVMLEHERLKDSNFEGMGEYSRYQPALSGAEWDAIMPPVDIIGRLFPGKYEEDGEMKTGRFVSFVNTTEWVGTDKSNRLSGVDRIRLTSPENCWKDIEKVFKESEVKRGHGRVSSG